MTNEYSKDESITKQFFWRLEDVERVFKKCLQEQLLSKLPKEEEEVLDIKEASKLIRLSVSTIRKHTKSGLLKKLYPEVRKNLYHKEELLKFNNYYRNKLG